MDMTCAIQALCSVVHRPNILQVFVGMGCMLFITLSTLAFLSCTGWARFCLLDRALYPVQLKAQSACDERVDHCRLKGYEQHRGCLEASSGCWNPIREICGLGVGLCRQVMDALPEPIKMLLRMASEQLQIRKWYTTRLPNVWLVVNNSNNGNDNDKLPKLVSFPRIAFPETISLYCIWTKHRYNLYRCIVRIQGRLEIVIKNINYSQFYSFWKWYTIVGKLTEVFGCKNTAITICWYTSNNIIMMIWY